MAGEHQVRGGLALSGVGVHIAAHQPAGLARHQGPAVGRLAHRLIGGGQVQDNGGPRLGQGHGGGIGGPQVLADLHADDQLRQFLTGVKTVAVHAHILAAQLQHVVHAARSPGGREPALLVKFPVIGQVGLGHQAQNLSFLYNSGTIIQFVVPFVPHGQAHGGDHIQILGGVQDGLEPLLGAPEQGILEKEVAAGVAGEAQLRQCQDLHALLVGLPHEGEDLLGIIAAVRHPNLRGTGGDFDKSIFHSP